MNKTVLIITGPTAIGKTDLSLQLAQYFKTDIISADSRQCFRELNIGVAKPDPEELALVPHYFINSHSIHDRVDAGVYEQYALHAAAEIFKQHDIAVMVGGTGLYVKAFSEGIDEMPAIPQEIRDKVIRLYDEQGLAALQTEVQQLDPVFWSIAEQQNPQRLMRALEMVYATGQSITEFRKGTTVQRPFKIIKIGLELPREVLYERINKRVDIMIAQGLVEEVRSLLPVRSLNALQTVGYRELFDYFDNTASLETAINSIKTNTRHYAKRQMTWFKKDTQIKWYKPDEMERIISDLKL
ncbi:MAG: tRNA (adenosine(37)-N6)-dimethylallyltransferase MiaA [Filimonas sp.]|nr:tRNA (adenosine(37)-N6)-dimethylallyltransferase MiaA [Filimonas sp.]